MNITNEEFEKIKAKARITEQDGVLVRENRKYFNLDSRQDTKPEQSFGDVIPAKNRRKAENKEKNRSSSKEKPVVVLISLRRKLITDASESLPVGFKYHRDAIADELGMDDSDANIKWEYGQVKTSGPEGVIACISMPGNETTIKEWRENCELPVD